MGDVVTLWSYEHNGGRCFIFPYLLSLQQHPSIKLITNPETCFSQLFDKLLFIYGKSHFNCQINNPQGPHRILWRKVCGECRTICQFLVSKVSIAFQNILFRVGSGTSGLGDVHWFIGFYIFIVFFDRIYWILQPRLNGQPAGFNWVKIIFLYLKFPEEIPNEQSATPKRETFVQRNIHDFMRFAFNLGWYFLRSPDCLDYP